MAKDKYESFEKLQAGEKAEHFTVNARGGKSGIAVIAPHGGGIEPGTYELADAIAADEHAFYGFDAKRPSGNADLHVTSTNFDEPTGTELVTGSKTVVALHGCQGDEEVVYLGGTDRERMERIRSSLTEAGFTVDEHDRPELQGEHPANICNRGQTKRGVQLELSEGLRSLMFEALNRKGRGKTRPLFDEFVAAMKKGLRGATGRTKEPGTAG